MAVWIANLLDRYESATRWPLEDDEAAWDEVAKWIAFRENDREQLKDLHDEWPAGRRYRVDPLAPLISSSYASLAFGREPTFDAAEPGDQERLDFIVEENEMAAELQRARQTSSSEGSVWWRIYVDREVAEAPLLEWHSRAGVSPLWVGRKLRAVCFVTRLDPVDEQDEQTVWRLLELHDDEDVLSVLYRGQDRDLGEMVDLTEHPDTLSLREEPWNHGLGHMLAGWIPNLTGAVRGKGYSDYEPVEDFLLELNETLTVAHENMRLTAKKRLVAPRSSIDETGRLIGGDDDVIIADEDQQRTLGEGDAGKGPWQILEYEFDAAAMGQYRKDLAVDGLNRIGITPQFVGLPTDAEGLATSGVALRLRLLPSVNASRDRDQHWDSALPRVFELLQQVDALPFDSATAVGGFDRPWQAADEAPSIDRGSPLPEDDTEQVTRLSTEVEARLLSRQTAIEERHPDWTPERVIEELRRIAVDDGLDSARAEELFPMPDEAPDAQAEADAAAAVEDADTADQGETADVG